MHSSGKDAVQRGIHHLQHRLLFLALFCPPSSGRERAWRSKAKNTQRSTKRPETGNKSTFFPLFLLKIFNTLLWFPHFTPQQSITRSAESASSRRHLATSVRQQEHFVCFRGPPSCYNYFGYRLQRANGESWVVYVTGRSGLFNSERLTLSKCTPWEVGGGGRIWNSSWSIRFNINLRPRGTSVDLYSHDHANTYLSSTPGATFSLLLATPWAVTSAETGID